jgi:murein DD-endopeptidase MepM/ murein hydrolase activator NlpD
MKKTIGTVFLVLVICLLGVSAFMGFRLFEGSPPVIKPLELPSIIGKKAVLGVQVSDDGSGLKEVSAEIVQAGKHFPLGTREFTVAPRWKGSEVKAIKLKWEIVPAKLGLSSADLEVRVTAHDASFRNGAKGNEAVLSIPLKVDFTPPVVTVLSTVHNIKVGGAGACSFTVSEKVVKAGVAVGDIFFNAVKGPDNIYRVLFALPFNMDKPGSIVVKAWDIAGNEGTGGMAYRVFPRKKVRDTINITDRFLQRKIPGFASSYPEIAAPSLLDTFLKVNSLLREKNNKFLLSLCGLSAPEILWKGAFKRFPGARKAGFADERHYFYKGKEIDQAFHMGVDIASTMHAPVPAANAGKVVFCSDNGIYGNTVVIDHGMGLMSLYAHLNQINVTKGEDVKKGQIIGRTDSTGLAGGDHLHFGMMLAGVFINPVEWWDARWIRDHITYNLDTDGK